MAWSSKALSQTEQNKQIKQNPDSDLRSDIFEYVAFLSLGITVP